MSAERPERQAKHHAGIMTIVRITSWGLALVAILAVCIRYESLPSMLPISRWQEAPKSWLLALRVPGINLCMVGLADVYSRSLLRMPASTGFQVSAILLVATAGLKSVIEVTELLLLPTKYRLLPILLVGLVVVGLGLAALASKEEIANGKWKQIQASTAEKAAVAILLVCILLLNLPILIK